MKIIECTGCGGTLKESGKYFICENCGTRYAVGRDDEGNPFTYQPIEKKTIEYGTIEHKASHIEVNTLSVKEIKLDENVDVVVHKEGMNLEKQERIRLAKTFLLSREWNAAQDQVNNLLVEDNQCAEAKWFCLMLNHKAISDRELVAKLSAISENDRIAIDGILSNSSPIFARQILDVIFDSAFYNDDMCYALYSTAMPYAYNTSVYSEKELIDIKYSALETSVTRVFKRSFDYLLSITLNSDEVDKYISYLSRFASKCDTVSSQRYYSRILKVDPSNMYANHKMVLSDLQIDSPCEKIVNDFEHLLKFSDNTDNEVSQLLSYIVSEQTTTSAKSDFVWQLIGYHSLAPEVFKNELFKYAKLLLKTAQWNNAQKYYQLILSFDPRNADAYWGLCMVRMQARSESTLTMKKDNLIDCHEFKKSLSLYQSSGNVQRANELMLLTKKQRSRKKTTKTAILAGAGALILILLVIIISSLVNAVKYNTDINFRFEDESLRRYWANNKLQISLKSDSNLDIQLLEGKLSFYDKDNSLIAETLVKFEDLVHKEKSLYDFTIDNSAAEKLVNTRFNQLKITFTVTCIQFDDGVEKYPDENIVIKLSDDKPDYSKELKKKYDEIMSMLEQLDAASSTAENQLNAISKKIDVIYNDLYLSWDLLDDMYSKASDYQKKEEYFKALVLYVLLDQSFGYEGCADKAEYCYNMYFNSVQK